MRQPRRQIEKEKLVIKVRERFTKKRSFPKLDPPLTEEPFLKAIKVLGGKSLERVPFFSGKMDHELVME